MQTVVLVSALLSVLVSLAASVIWVHGKIRNCFRSLSVTRSELADLRSQLLRLRVETTRLRKSTELLAKREDASQRVQFPLLRSQFGEDLILLALFGADIPGFFVEAGGYDGLTFSTTAVLESLGWKGLLIEPHPQLFESCRKNRPGALVKHAALGAPGEVGSVEFTCVDYASGSSSPLSFRSAFVEQGHVERCRAEGALFRTTAVPVITLDQALLGLTERVDVLVLDIEGQELRVLEGFDLERFCPVAVLVEVHWNEQDQIVRDWFAAKQYVSCGLIGCNEFFAPRGSAEKLRSIIAAFPDC